VAALSTHLHRALTARHAAELAHRQAAIAGRQLADTRASLDAAAAAVARMPASNPLPPPQKGLTQ
jgi:hypothetical protein